MVRGLNDAIKMGCAMNGAEDENVDVVIVGAGFAGLYALHKLRSAGFDAIILEAGEDVGGTWYWNRYPGVRVDIESLEYSYSFSPELQQEWEWTERYASQAELLAYLGHVADRFDLRRSIRFGQRVSAAHYDATTNRWLISTTDGDSLRARTCVMATGFLSAPNQPSFPGQADFVGAQYHTAYWPQGGVEFTGLKVGVIGTGSSAIQCIPIIAKQAAQLTVFQRTPAFVVPLRNCPMPPDYQARVKADYAEWRRRQREDSGGGWIAVNFDAPPRITASALDVSEVERTATYERLWESGGLSFYNAYPDIFTSFAANDTLAEFLRAKIRARVDDPAVADLLVPTDYPVLGKRLCADNGYYEAYNRDNVGLVDIRGQGIKMTPSGIRVKGEDYELDVIVHATGFDALTGALARIDIRGLDGEALKDHWTAGACTALGLMTAGFPNLFFLNGPGSPCPLYQPVLLGEEQVDWIAAWLAHLRTNGIDRIEASAELEDEWTSHCTDVVNATIFPHAASWYMGSNITGKPPIGLAYFGGIANYRSRCAAVLPAGFPGFHLGSTAA
jgi:cation diffusion facilitator CzcD-associated flavoprotein CzcO